MKRRERVTCLYRDCDCWITSWSNAPISWPRVQPIGKRGGSGLWVNDELKRAICTESADALIHWFGVSANTVWAWRMAFGVDGRVNTTKGSKRAIRAAAKEGAAATKAKEWTPKERKAKSRIAKRLGLKPSGRWKGEEWTAEQLALLGNRERGEHAGQQSPKTTGRNCSITPHEHQHGATGQLLTPVPTRQTLKGQETQSPQHRHRLNPLRLSKYNHTEGLTGVATRDKARDGDRGKVPYPAHQPSSPFKEPKDGRTSA